MPSVTETADAAANTATSYSLSVGQTAAGQLGVQGDADWYRINLVAGQTYTFAMVGTGVSSDRVGDTFLGLHNSAGTQIAFDDWGGPGSNSTITFTATASGVYYINAGSNGGFYTGQYGLSAGAGTRATYNEFMGAGALLREDLSWSTPGTPATVTWGVRATSDYTTDAQGTPVAFNQLTSAQISAVQASLAAYSGVANITFSQVNPGGMTNNATMLFGGYTSYWDGAGAFAYMPGSTASANAAGDVWLNSTSVSTTSLPSGSYDAFAILHEIGHALGLAHPGEYDAASGVPITYGNDAQFIQDSHQYTVMSYFDESNTTRSYNSYPDTLMLYDIFALQQLYGANMTVRAGNTTYGFNSNAGAVFNFAINSDPVLSIWDAGGTDTLNVSGFSQQQVIDLRAGAFSSIGGLTRNVSIAFGAVIENATGGSGADWLIGNSEINVLNGNAGPDTMLGGNGDDTYIVDNAGDMIDETGSNGVDRINSLISYSLASTRGAVEYLVLAGSANLTATGNALDNLLIGNSGINVLNGNAGADTMRGGNGDDTYIVDNGGDIVDETGSTGVDRINSLVSFSLADTVHVKGPVEYLVLGGGANINATGNGLNNLLVGNLGDNVLDGGIGADTMRGANGHDTYIVDNAGDVVDETGSYGFDRIHSVFSFSLADTAHVRGAFEYLAVQGSANINASGNALNNVLVGNLGINVLNGNTGADRMFGGNGDDTYIVDNAGDTVDETGSDGIDRINSLVSFSLADTAHVKGDVEYLVLAGSANINATGNALDNLLVGNAGRNILTGGVGADTFFFKQPLNSVSNLDRITDFSVLDDTIRLDHLVFNAFMATGALEADAFHIGATAADANDHILYNDLTGTVSYDADGVGGRAAVNFASVASGLSMTHDDFWIV